MKFVSTNEGAAILSGAALAAVLGIMLGGSMRPQLIFDDGFLAVENRCPHGGGPLADGIVGGTTVTCPLHNWRVCLESGAIERPCESGAPAVATFPIEVVDGIVMLALDQARVAA